MKSPDKNHAREAFTLVEVIVIIAVVALAALMILPALIHPRIGDSSRIRCMSNLKQLGLAFRIWEGDNGGLYPTQYYTNAAGEQLFANSANAFRYFQAMSNEISNPQVLICPQDKYHRAATNFTTDFNGSHISYFVSLDADENHPQMFLSGDANLTNDMPLKNGILEDTPSHPPRWTRDRHDRIGNIAFADGSVQQFSIAALNAASQHSGTGTTWTNRLLIPR